MNEPLTFHTHTVRVQRHVPRVRTFQPCCVLLLTTPSYSLQFIVLAILATRMHLHLWNTDQHLRGLVTDALVLVPMSDASSRRPAP
jgi:hypothetical protein